VLTEGIKYSVPAYKNSYHLGKIHDTEEVSNWLYSYMRHRLEKKLDVEWRMK
jgi:hypothetical protein